MNAFVKEPGQSLRRLNGRLPDNLVRPDVPPQLLYAGRPAPGEQLNLSSAVDLGVASEQVEWRMTERVSPICGILMDPRLCLTDRRLP